MLHMEIKVFLWQQSLFCFLYNKFNEEVKLDTNSIEERQKIIKKLRKFETTETISLQDVINQNKFKKLSWYALKKSHLS